MATLQVYQDFTTDLGTPVPHEWVDVSDDKRPLEVVLFVEAVNMGLRQPGPDGTFWYERGEIHTKSWAGAGARLYRLRES
jgi:hypothetical protein